MTEAPVVVLDVSDQQVEVLRIEENLRRRGLKPSETARAIRRLYELHDIRRGPRAMSVPEPVSAATVETPPIKTAVDIARDAGMNPTQAKVYNRLADLIPPLMQLLDARTITQAVAYQLTQLPAAELWIIGNQLARRNLRDEQRSYLRGKFVKGLDVKLGRPNKGDKLSPLSSVAAHEHVTERTVERDAQYAAAVDTLEHNVPGAKETILAGESGLPKAEVVKLARCYGSCSQVQSKGLDWLWQNHDRRVASPEVPGLPSVGPS